MISYKKEFIEFIHNLQDEICESIENEEEKEKFKEDIWERPEGGGGKTRIIENGALIEKGGVNTSIVFGTLPEIMQKQFKVKEGDFFACGISLVLHPNNPFIPTVHANYRYFELYDNDHKLVDMWFAGGSDLTPYYYYEEDAIHFHQINKNTCDKFDAKFYLKYKKSCDNYFYNQHRDEARGIGGLFIDYLRPTSTHSEKFWFDFIKSVGNGFLASYLPIVKKRRENKYTRENKDWQEIRRGRYVEFNLIHDKGTLFGLKTNGRIESILMSLPPRVQWVYNFKPVKDSAESKTLDILKTPKDYKLN
tara:strand:- start:1291 stop:2208 length:918 start_codon:yes stop_codon:yes gene_type:complete